MFTMKERANLYNEGTRKTFQGRTEVIFYNEGTRYM